MKLYVWNYEHNAFGCLGIGRILEMREQLNQEDDIECKLGTAVFYKGIKVTEKYFNEDANMLEYIDLKKTLDNSYLKLNRNGFSTEGDKQLTKAYRALLNTAGTVLAEFADKNKVIERIIKDIKTSLSEVKDEDDEKTIASVRRKIMSAVALLYFASVHANSYEMKMHKQTDGAGAMGWNQLIEELADVWNDPEKAEKVKWVKQSSEMFNLPVLKYKNGEVAEDIEYQSIVDIANRNRKYAIMSVREKKSHFWNEYVIEITSVDESIKSEINTLSMVQDDMEQRIEAMRELSGLVKPLFAVNYETYIQEGKIGLEKIRKDMTILRWILNNVPTMAVFSNNTGDMRLNILDLEVTDTVYFDENMKYLILQRMLEPTFNKIETVYRVRKHAERFSTIVWPGYKDLVIDNMRRSVMSVNRGKMSAVGCSEMIFPLSHQLLKQIDKAIRDDVQIQAIQKYGEKVLKPISEYIDSVPEELRTKFRENLSRLLCDEQMKEKIDSWGKDWLPNGSLDLDENTCKQFVEQFKENILVNADNLTDTEKKAVAVIQWLAVTYKAEMTNTSYKADFAKKLDEEEEVYHNLLRYVSKNSRFKTVESEVDRMYRNMVVEVAYIIRKKLLKTAYRKKKRV